MSHSGWRRARNYRAKSLLPLCGSFCTPPVFVFRAILALTPSGLCRDRPGWRECRFCRSNNLPSLRRPAALRAWSNEGFSSSSTLLIKQKAPNRGLLFYMAESEGLAPCGRCCYALVRCAVEPLLLIISGSNSISTKTNKPAINAGSLVLAESEGFEPSMELQTPYSLSRGAPSAARPALQYHSTIPITRN